MNAQAAADATFDRIAGRRIAVVAALFAVTVAANLAALAASFAG